MLQPKNFKYSKVRNRVSYCNKLNMFINFGLFGMKSIEFGFIKSSQIESTRRVISKILKRQGKIWIRIFPDIPITKKPLEVRMGKGKGNLEYWVFFIKPGFILYEVDYVDEYLAKKAFKIASSKLPIKTVFVKK